MEQKIPISVNSAIEELIRRRSARKNLLSYILYTNKRYKTSEFSKTVCNVIDQFIVDVQLGLRPIIVFQSPPQHGKSEIVSRKLPSFLLGRFPDIRIGTASYSDELATSMAQDVRRTLVSDEHRMLFPAVSKNSRYIVNRLGEFTAPGGTGGYISVGVGSGLTGRPVDIGIIDDPIKNEKEALSSVVKDGHWSWYQSVFTTRLSENNGQIIMATSWAEDDLPSRICEHYRESNRLTILRFPAINLPGEVGYNPKLPKGALVEELHSLKKLNETKSFLSDYWWSALYQQTPKALGGNVFKETGIRFYLPKELPKKFSKVIASWDCTFKDTNGTDYVVGQVWGKYGANVYLLAQTRNKMSFTRTVSEVVELKEKWPLIREILIEDKANGPAVIDVLKNFVPGLLPVTPDGSKLARAHAITSYWEAGNVWLPDPAIASWVKDFVGELTAFPASANDDQVDAMSQALRHLYPAFEKLNVKRAALLKAMGI